MYGLPTGPSVCFALVVITIASGCGRIRVALGPIDYSHSMVPGGLLVMS
jgi:hypothetical protein